MTITEYVEALEKDRSETSSIEGDRQKELDYLRAGILRFEDIMRCIPALSRPIRLLDIGTTEFTLYLKQTFPHYDVWTLDRTNLLERRCEQAGIPLKACNLDDGVLPFEDEFFDVVVFTQVLEHIFAPPTEILAEINRIMKHSGTLILGVPNIARLSKRLKLLFGISPLPDADHQMNKDWKHGHGHIHEYTRNELLAHCRLAKLKVLRTRMLAVRNPLRMLQGRSEFGLAKFLYYSVIAPFPSLRGYIHLQCCK